MQELAIILSSLAGVATAAAVRGRSGGRIPRIGASSQIKSQVGSLGIEKDILTKTIARLYQADSEYTKVQKDRLLLKYQHQLGVVLARMEKLDQASRHPDLGPVGDGLITLMDKRLSKLDERLYEISSRITVKEPEIPKVQRRAEKKAEAPIVPAGPRQPLEITTLTSIPKTRAVSDPGPVRTEQAARTEKQTVLEPVQIVPGPVTVPVQKVPIADARINVSDAAADPLEGDDAELEEIKHSITKVLSKLDQAEVE